MKRWACGLAVIGTMVGASQASAVLLVNPDGSPVGGQWQRWANETKIPTPPVTVTFSTTGNECAGAPACSSTATTQRGPYLVGLNKGPLQIVVLDDTRDSLYFELGHLFDATVLTPPDRSSLLRAWQLPRWHWWDTTAALTRGGEDGGEGVFAAIYSDCAEGTADRNLSIMLLEPRGIVGPDAITNDHPCRLIRQMFTRTTRP